MSKRMPIATGKQHNQSIDAELVAYMRRLQSHITLATTRLKVYELIHNARRSDDYRTALGPYKTFFLIVEDALYLDVGVTIEKLFDPKGKRSLPRYLRRCLHELSKLSVEPSRLNKEILEEQLQQIEQLNPAYKRLKKIRNKWLAHHDAIAFDDPQSFSNQHYVPTEDLRPFVNVAQEILVAHFHARGSDLVPGLPGEDDIQGLLDTLEKFHRIRVHWGLNEIGPEEALEKLYEIETRLRGDPF